MSLASGENVTGMLDDMPLVIGLPVCHGKKTPSVVSYRKRPCNGVFTPEQDNDKTTTRQMLNLCIPMMPFSPGPTCLV